MKKSRTTRTITALLAGAAFGGAVLAGAGAAQAEAPPTFPNTPNLCMDGGMIQASWFNGGKVTDTACDDVIYGTEGDDVIHIGWGGKDTVYGLGGNDKIIVSNHGATVLGGNGDDFIFVEVPDPDADIDPMEWQGKDVQMNALGGPGDDTLSGGSYADYLNGGPGQDDIYAGAGSDIVMGEAGDDYIATNTTYDGLVGGGLLESDKVWAGDGEDYIDGQDGWAGLLDGGDGYDWAAIDLWQDLVPSVEKTTPEIPGYDPGNAPQDKGKLPRPPRPVNDVLTTPPPPPPPSDLAAFPLPQPYPWPAPDPQPQPYPWPAPDPVVEGPGDLATPPVQPGPDPAPEPAPLPEAEPQPQPEPAPNPGIGTVDGLAEAPQPSH